MYRNENTNKASFPAACLRRLSPWLWAAFAPAALAADNGPRLVVTQGTLTEIVHALGALDLVVGVDQSSVYPEAVDALPQVGYSRALSAEGILSLRPDQVWISEEAGPPSTVEHLRISGVDVHVFSAEPSVEAARERVLKAGALLQRGERAEEIAGDMRAGLESVAAESEGGDKPKVLFIYARSGGTMNVSGRGTAADVMIRLAGGENAVRGFEGFRPLTAEGAALAAPDFVLVTTRGLESIGGKRALLGMPGVAQTPAARHGRVIVIDDLLLLGFGPRLGEAVEELWRQLRGGDGKGALQ